MKRLTIGWNGTSAALQAIRQMLEQYGHATGDEAVDLWIEDGSLPLPSDIGEAPCIRLRLGVGAATEYGLPALQLRAYDRQRRLHRVLEIADEPTGNGERQRKQVTNALMDWVALQVSEFSRDPAYVPTSTTANDWPEQSLLGLDALAFMHRFNCTANPALMQEAQVPVMERVQASLHAFAERPALNINGYAVSYSDLHRRAAAIQQRLIPLLEALKPPRWSVFVWINPLSCMRACWLSWAAAPSTCRWVRTSLHNVISSCWRLPEPGSCWMRAHTLCGSALTHWMSAVSSPATPATRPCRCDSVRAWMHRAWCSTPRAPRGSPRGCC